MGQLNQLLIIAVIHHERLVVVFVRNSLKVRRLVPRREFLGWWTFQTRSVLVTGLIGPNQWLVKCYCYVRQNEVDDALFFGFLLLTGDNQKVTSGNFCRIG